jgi:hypothetical protein
MRMKIKLVVTLRRMFNVNVGGLSPGCCGYNVFRGYDAVRCPLSVSPTVGNKGALIICKSSGVKVKCLA